MKKIKKAIRDFLIGLLPILVLASFAGTAYAEEDMCENIDGIQTTMQSGHSSVGSPGQCYELQIPVTIDIVPPGGEPITIDINPVDAEGNSGPAQTIDVNPVGLKVKTFTESNATTSVSTTTPTVITSVEQLQAYIFDPKATNEEKVLAIEQHIVSLLKQIIEILKVEIEAALQAASSTPSQI